MKTLISLIAAFLSGGIGAMGLGGGAVLIIYLAFFMGVNQFKAQGINLLFFIPIAITATIIYTHKKLIDFKTVLPISAGGIVGTFLGAFAATLIGVKWVGKLFGAGILLLGISEIIKGIKTLLAKRKNKCYNKTE